MLVFEPNPEDRVPLVVIFGTGLLGSAMKTALQRNVFYRVRNHPMDWRDRASIKLALKRVSEVNASSATRVEIIWTAGKAGFSANRDQVRDEMQTYRYAVATLGQMMERRKLPVGFSLTSSAGGLFEGQRYVDTHNHAAPQRPYQVFRTKKVPILGVVGFCGVRFLWSGLTFS